MNTGTVKNPVREHGASSMEKAICIWGLIAPKNHIAIHPRPEEWGILAFSRLGLARPRGCTYKSS